MGVGVRVAKVEGGGLLQRSWQSVACFFCFFLDVGFLFCVLCLFLFIFCLTTLQGSVLSRKWLFKSNSKNCGCKADVRRCNV